MPKFTVWMSGEDTLYSWNRSPRKFDNIEASNFLDACRYVWEYYHDGMSGRWILSTDDGVPTLSHAFREWSYGLYPTEAEALLATNTASTNPRPLRLTHRTV